MCVCVCVCVCVTGVCVCVWDRCAYSTCKCLHHAHVQWISNCVECNAMDSASNKLAMAILLSKQRLHFHVWDIVTKFMNMAAIVMFSTDCLSFSSA